MTIMELSRLAVGMILISVLSFARAQVDCPAFNVSDLGSTDMLTQGGLVRSALEAVSGDTSNPASVQVHTPTSCASEVVALGTRTVGCR